MASCKRYVLPFVPVVVTGVVLLASAPGGPGIAAGGATSGVWITTGNMTMARGRQTATLFSNGDVLVTGGCGNSCHSLASAELYDPNTGTWAATGSMSTPRQAHTATLLPNGQVLVAGGCSTCGPAFTSAELYDPSTGTWTPTGSMTTARGSSATATLLPSGKVLVAGGYSGTCCWSNVVSSAELYDPSTGTWMPTGNMSSPRAGHTATLLPGGQVLVAGGTTCLSCPILASAELYNPATGTWTATGSLNTARQSYTATLLNNGQVLVAGGTTGTGDSNVLTSSELYDPNTGTWTPTGSLNTARFVHTATLRPNGTVLVAGGCPTGHCSTLTSSAELYDPATGTWTTTGSMSSPRAAQTATLLPDGEVLVPGGCSDVGCGSPLANAELYVQPTANLTLSPTSGFYKESLVITGTAFAPAEVVNIYADVTTTAPIYTAQAGPDGSFVLHTTVLAGPYGSHALIGVGRHSGLFGVATFFETPRLIMTPNSGTAGSTITAHGYGFGAGETVQVYWRNPKQLLGTTTTNSVGSFTGSSAVTFTIPSGAPPGINIVYGVGQSTRAIGSGPVRVH